MNENYFKPTPAEATILKDTSYYRVLNLTQDVFNDAITSYHFHSVGGYHPAKLSIVEDLLNYQLRKQPINLKVLNMLNTKYILTENPQTHQAIPQINPEALGPVWFVKAIQFEKSPAAVMKDMNNFNPKDTALIEEINRSQINNSIQLDSTASISLVNNDNDFIEYRSASKTNEYAVFSEIYYDRGWKAYIDGKESPIIQTNYVLRGLAVPAGNHKITFEFCIGLVIIDRSGDSIIQKRETKSLDGIARHGVVQNFSCTFGRAKRHCRLLSISFKRNRNHNSHFN